MPGTTNDKDMFKGLYKGLEHVRKKLKQCTSMDEYVHIIKQYNQIETKHDLIKEYLKDHKSAKKALVGLENKIALLMTILNKKYEIEPLEYQNLEEEHFSSTHEEFEHQYNKKVIQIREQQLSQYTQLIMKLETKRDEFHIRYPDDSIDDVNKAYGAATQLINILNGYAQLYKIQEIDLEQLKENSSRVIQDKRKGVLGDHRGFKEIMTNLLFAIGTLGIGYSIAALFTQRLAPIKCNTETVNMLVETEQVLDGISNDKIMGI